MGESAKVIRHRVSDVKGTLELTAELPQKKNNYGSSDRKNLLLRSLVSLQHSFPQSYGLRGYFDKLVVGDEFESSFE